VGEYKAAELVSSQRRSEQAVVPGREECEEAGGRRRRGWEEAGGSIGIVDQVGIGVQGGEVGITGGEWRVKKKAGKRITQRRRVNRDSQRRRDGLRYSAKPEGLQEQFVRLTRCMT
jgi:hypothetical protein